MGPLRGIRILDLTSVVMGPFATTILGDLGADIIKLESPQGDVVRQIGPSRSGRMGGLFMHANRSKRSIAIDLKSAEGRALALQLAASCDVVFYNIRPRAMARLGLSFDEVKAAKDDIIYVGALGYGQGGAYSDDPAYDDLIQGLAAVPSLIAEANGGEPRYVPVNIADRMVGMYASTAILAAILHRNATGQGQKIDIPMFETMASVVLGDHLGGRSYVPPLDAGGYRRLLSPARMPTRTADGFLCVLLYTQKNRDDFVTLIESHDAASAARIGQAVREGGSTPMINAEMAQIFPSRTTAEWEASLRQFDIPHKRLHTIDTLIDDPHLADVGFFTQEEHPLEGAVVSMKVPSTWSVSTPEITRLAPMLGEHTREVLREISLGEAQIEDLMAQGIVVEDGMVSADRTAIAG